ncbi:MAG: RNA pseudouridine synthase [Elusimicrobia bacterium]|nr:RNA pseudouridine synthase [Elusimicrobiota bacterium]
MQVLYQDARVIAVHKPAGQLVIPGRGDSDILCLKDEMAAGLGGPVFVVHRIDRETSGIVLFAKDPDAHRFLCAAFEKQAVKKEYWAAVLGSPSPAEGFVASPLRAFGSGRMGPDPLGKPSRTEYSTVARWPGGALLAVRPVTGRRHQIRAHLAERGHPILGDPLYGPPPRPVGGAPRLLLHARALLFPHPDGSPRSVLCEPDDYFFSILNVVSKSKIVYLETGRAQNP